MWLNPVQPMGSTSEDLDPSWSTGGNLLFSSDRDGNFDIYLRDAVGAGLVSITDVGRDDEDGINERWPDMVAFEGQWRITYSSSRFGDWEIHSIDADGENIARATDHEDTDGSASWGPSGEEFVFHTDRNKQGMELFISPDPFGDGQKSISGPVFNVNYFCRLASIILAGSPPYPAPAAGPLRSGSWGR